MSTVTGALRLLREDAMMAAPSPDGAVVAYKNSDEDEVWVMNADGSAARKLVAAQSSYWFERIIWSPNGQRVAYMKSTRALDQVTIESVDLQGGDARIVLSDRRVKDFAWLVDGRIVYSVSEPPPSEYESSLWEIAADPATGRPAAKPRRLTQWPGTFLDSFSLTADGKALGYVNRRDQSDVYVADLEANGGISTPRRLTVDDRIDWPAGWTPDSKTLIFYSDRNGTLDIFKQGVTARTAEGVYGSPEDERYPQVSADGAWLFYMAWTRAEGSAPPTAGRLMRLRLSGAAPESVLAVKGYPGSAQVARLRRLLTAKGHPDFRCVNAGTCLVSEPDRERVVFSTVDPLQGRKQEVAVVEAPPRSKYLFWDVSPDGAQLAFGTQDRKAGRFTVLSLADGGRREIIVPGWANFDSIAWAADGQSWFVTSYSTRGSSLLRVDARGQARLLYKASMWLERPAPSPDGRYLAFGQVSSNGNAWLIENLR